MWMLRGSYLGPVLSRTGLSWIQILSPWAYVEEEERDAQARFLVCLASGLRKEEAKLPHVRGPWGRSTTSSSIPVVQEYTSSNGNVPRYRQADVQSAGFFYRSVQNVKSSQRAVSEILGRARRPR